MAARSKALDGARGCGFLLVLLAHIDPARFMVGGVLGVGFFFVLSGYLITQQAVRSTGMLEYYRRRFQRILPLLYLYLCLNALVAVALGHSMRGYGWHFAFMSDWLSSWNLAPKTGGVVGHLWTIAIEAQFYLVWPVILAIAGPKRIYVLLALIGGAILWRMLVGDAYLATMTLPARIDAFAAGGLAAIAAHRKWRAPTLIAGAVAVSYAIISVPISQFAQPTGWSSAAPSMLAGMAAAFAALVSILAEVQPRALEYRPLTWAGSAHIRCISGTSRSFWRPRKSPFASLSSRAWGGGDFRRRLAVAYMDRGQIHGAYRSRLARLVSPEKRCC